jgi:hypothetical protein
MKKIVINKCKTESVLVCNQNKQYHLKKKGSLGYTYREQQNQYENRKVNVAYSATTTVRNYLWYKINE